jgi:hypothetical protein
MTTQVMPLSERESFWATREKARGNELDYEVTLNILGLPAAEHAVDADAVRVCTADVNVLAAWFFEKGGQVTRAEQQHGVTVWTLDTTAGADEGHVGCRVLVTLVAASSAFVPSEIRDAAVSL